MSTAAISYDGLRRSVSEASDVAKKLDRYEGSLNSSVLRKLDSYSGNWTGNLSTVRNCVNRKISELQDDQNRFENYSRNLDNLKRQCETTERAVRSRISTLTNSFKEAYHVKVGYWEEKIGSFFTRLRNGSSFGKWIGEKYDDLRNFQRNIKSEIKQWYNFDGGKDFLKGLVVVALEGIIAICSIVVAVCTFPVSGIWAGIVAAASLIGGVIALVDAAVNLQGELSAVGMAGEDPATAKRRREINSFADYAKSSFLYGKDGEHYEYSAGWNMIANAVEITSTICSLIAIGDGIWKTGSKFFTFKGKVFGQGFKKGVGVLTEGLKKGFKDMLQGVKDSFMVYKREGVKAVKELVKSGLKKEFFNFKNLNSAKSVKDGAKIIKDGSKSVLNIVNLGDTIEKEGLFDLKVWKDIAHPVIKAHVLLDAGEDKDGGKLQIKTKDIWDSIKKGKSFFENINDKPEKKYFSAVEKVQYAKFGSKCNADIVPYQINIPKMELPVFRAA